MRDQFSKWTNRDLTAVINDRYHTGKNGTDYAPVIEFIQSELLECKKAIAKHYRELSKIPF